LIDHGEMIHQAQVAEPHLWAVCYPRIYKQPAGNHWCSPKIVSLQLFATVAAHAELEHRLGRVGVERTKESNDYEFQVASHLLHYRLPLYWLTPALAEAIGKTRSNIEIDWWNMKLPVDAGVLMLPRGILVHPQDGDILWIAWAKMQPGVAYPSPFNKEGGYSLVNGGIILLCYAECGYLTHWNIPLDLTPERIMLEDIERQSTSTHASLFHHVEMTDADRGMATRIAHYVFMTAMVLEDRPALLRPAVLEKRVCRKGEVPREFWSPNVLGEGYRIREAPSAPTGEHRSPILHLVRGFWKEQAHGPAWSLRTARWIDPYWRGGNAE
jgi:hypothetical protein